MWTHFVLGRLALMTVVFVGAGELRASQSEDPANGFIPLVASQQELDAFRAVEVETRLGVRLGLIDSFLEAFPESELRYMMLRSRWRSLVEARSNPRVVIEAAEEGLDAARRFMEPRLRREEAELETGYGVALLEFRNLETSYYRSMANAAAGMEDLSRVKPYTEQALSAEAAAWSAFQRLVFPETTEYLVQSNAHRANQMNLFQSAMLAFWKAGEVDGAFDYGRRALELDPGDVLTLVTLSSLIAESPPNESSERQLRLRSGLDFATRAVQVLAEPEEPGAGIVPDELVRLHASVRTTRGVLHYHLGEYDLAAAELLRALEVQPGDADAYFWLGLAYLATDQSEAALSALARAVHLGVDDPDARASLEQVYRANFGSLIGVDAYVEREGARDPVLP